MDGLIGQRPSQSSRDHPVFPFLIPGPPTFEAIMYLTLKFTAVHFQFRLNLTLLIV